MSSTSRRQFLQSASLAGIASASLPYWFSPESMAASFRSPNERPVLGCIGTGDRWNAVGPNAMKFADCAAVCDVDVAHVEKGRRKHLRCRASLVLSARWTCMRTIGEYWIAKILML
jgi:hypothetical protein